MQLADFLGSVAIGMVLGTVGSVLVGVDRTVVLISLVLKGWLGLRVDEEGSFVVVAVEEDGICIFRTTMQGVKIFRVAFGMLPVAHASMGKVPVARLDLLGGSV